MLINGEKYACEACVRGHRVSSCHHSDRQLVHVNKKGRPVSQCQHCRGMRKSRAQHVHCECNQKGHSQEDCPHDMADGKHEPGTCCCQHTSKCTCAAKKDHLDAVPEDIPQVIQPKDPLKRLSNHNSHDSKPTIFSNGHHKPVHKFNDSHNQFGSPYKIPSRSHTVHGHREIAQRSTDSLPLLNKIAKPHHESPLHSIMNAESTRQVRSEHNSPMLGPTLPAPDTYDIPPFNAGIYGYSPFSNSPDPGSQSGLPPLNDDIPRDWFMSYEEAHQYQPPKWANDNFDSTDSLPAVINNNNKNSFNMNQPSTLGAFDPFTQFALFNNASGASSGDISEVEEFSPGDPRSSVPRSISQEASNDLSSNGGEEVTPDRYRISSASSYYGTPQANMLATERLGALDIDDYLKQAEVETRKMQIQNQQYQMMHQNAITSPEELQIPAGQRASNASSSIASPPPALHPFTIHEAQEYAHMNQNQRMQQDSKPYMATASMAEDPAWSVAPDLSNPTLSLDGDEQEDEDWVR